LAGPAKADTLSAFRRKSVACPLSDDAPLPLRGGCHDIRHELACRRVEVDAEVERHEVPTLRLCSRHESREVEQRTREAVELGDDESIGLAASYGLESG
jgi:hypothetical protein